MPFPSFSPITGATIEELLDSMEKQRKEMQWLLSSLDTQNMKELNADIINAGKIKAEHVTVGGDTTFDEGYDPNAALLRAQQAEANAKIYSDQLKATTDQEIADINTELTNLDTYVDGAFKDGVISEAEAKAIEKYLNTLNSEKSDIDNRYTTVYNDAQLTGTPKTTLATKKSAYNTAHTNLLNSIDTAIADGKTTSAEKTDVDTKFASYRTALGELSTAFETAINTIAQAKATKALTDANVFTQEKIDLVNGDISDVNTRVDGLQNFTDTAFVDGVVTRAEKEALKSHLEQLNNEKSDLDNRYNAIYGDSVLAEAAKTNLASAKTAYNTAHTNLISSINTAVADSTITPAERTDVSNKFSTYRTSLGTLAVRFEEAIRYIETKKVDNVQVGGRNLVLNSDFSRGLEDWILGKPLLDENGIKYVSQTYEWNARQDDIEVDPLTEYMVSAKIRGTGNARVSIWGSPDGTNYTSFAQVYGGGSVDWKQTTFGTFTTLADTKFLRIYLLNTADGEFTDYTRIKFEKGNKATDWTPAPEDVDNAIAGLSTDISDVDGRVTALDTEINTTFKDGVIQEAEAKSIEKYINSLNAEKGDLDSRYNTIYAEAFLYGAPKTQLASAKSSYNTAHTNLINSINTAISDGKTTSTEKADVDSKFSSYRSALNLLSTRFEEAVKSIEQARVDNIQVGGRNYFKSTTDIINKAMANLSPRHSLAPNGFYATGNSTATGGVRLADVITENGWWTVSWDMRGTQSTPVGVTVDICDIGGKRFTTNSTNTFTRYSLSVEVTNHSSTYNFVDFDAFQYAYFYIDNIKVEKGNKATDWTPAPEDVDAAISSLDTELGQLQTEVTNLDTYVDGAFKDGVVSEAEAKAIEKYLNTVNTEKADVDNRYSTIYADPFLAGTAKTNLFSAKGSYNTAHTNLISSINTAIADGKATAAEKTDVDSKFTSYRTALSTLSTRFEEAVANIAERSSKYVDNGGSSRTFNNPNGASYDFVGGGIVGCLAIYTPITASKMVTMDIRGYNYLEGNAAIDLTVSFYIYGSSIVNTSCVNRGDYKINLVRVAKDANGRAVILLGALNQSWSYPSVRVVSVTTSYSTGAPVSYMDGWSTAIITADTGLTNIVTPTYTDHKADTEKLRTDLRSTAPLPTSIKLDSNGITASQADVSKFARMDYRGLYVQGGAIDIRTNGALANRGVVFDGLGLRGYNSSGVKTFEIDTNGNAYFSGQLNAATGTFTGNMTAGAITGASFTTTGSAGTNLTSIIELAAGSLNIELTHSTSGLQMEMDISGNGMKYKHGGTLEWGIGVKSNYNLMYVSRNETSAKMYTGLSPALLTMKYGASNDFDVATNMYEVVVAATQTTVTSPKDVLMNLNMITGKTEQGFCGTGAPKGTTSAVAGVGVNFRIKKNYTPSSITFTEGASSGDGVLSTNITADGFWLYLTSSKAQGTYIYWRGYYTA